MVAFSLPQKGSARATTDRAHYSDRLDYRPTLYKAVRALLDSKPFL